MKINIQTLHEQGMAAAKRYRQSEYMMVEILQKMDETLGYREYDYTSLHAYAVGAWKLSENVAYNLIAVARKSHQVPELKEKLQEQSITLSHAKALTTVITPDNKDQWLNAAQMMSKRQLEREIVKVRPEAAVQERMRPVAQNRLELKVGISEELSDEIKRVQDLLSSETQKPATLEETIQAAIRLYIEKKDPVKKAERAKPEKASPILLVPGPVKLERRSPLRAALKHQVNRRDRGQCTHRDSGGTRCKQRRWLDIHHMRPISRGGLDVLENLTTLCRTHHQMEHS